MAVDAAGARDLMERIFRSRGPYDNLSDWLRGLALSLAAAAFMTIVGAFGSLQAPIPLRFAYWLGLMVMGWLWGALVVGPVFARGRLRPVWAQIAVAALALAVPFSLVVGLASAVVFGARYDLAAIP